MKDRLKELVKDLVGEYAEAERGWIDRFNLKLSLNILTTANGNGYTSVYEMEFRGV